MVQEPTPLPSPLDALSHEARTTLRDALSRYLGEPDATHALRVALRLVTAEARARDLRPEQLMIGFKALWASLPEVRAVRDPVVRARMLERLITACIEEYYGA